jgi:hypothetical protein
MRRFWYYGASSAGASLLLDLYPATAAYSLRKLRTAYSGSAIRIRRTSDSAELDIGFVGGVVDTAAAIAFVLAGGGGASGLVSKIYNQGTGGSTYDAIQGTSTFQFFACSGLSFQLENTKPALLTNHVNGGGIAQKPPLNLSNRLDGVKTFFGVNKINNFVTINYLNGIETGDQSAGVANGIFQGGTAGGVNGIGSFNGIRVRSITGEDTNQQLAYINLRSGNLYAAKNGASETNAGTFSASLEVLQLGGRKVVFRTYLNGIFQEQIFYTTDESANKAAIETNINDYYGIY